MDNVVTGIWHSKLDLSKKLWNQMTKMALTFSWRYWRLKSAGKKRNIVSNFIFNLGGGEGRKELFSIIKTIFGLSYWSQVFLVCLALTFVIQSSHDALCLFFCSFLCLTLWLGYLFHDALQFLLWLNFRIHYGNCTCFLWEMLYSYLQVACPGWLGHQRNLEGHKYRNLHSSYTSDS